MLPDGPGIIPANNEYEYYDDIDFSVISMQIRSLPFYSDDLYLGMQATNIGVIDALITEYEYGLRRELFDLERTPPTALTVSALSQMWIFALYEVLRLWKDRRHKFKNWYEEGSIDKRLSAMKDEESNLTLAARKKQLRRYCDDAQYREEIDIAHECLKDAVYITNLARINLAKHEAPGQNNVIPMAPGYGRINRDCGSLDMMVAVKRGLYTNVNRRDIADCLRSCLLDFIKQIGHSR